MNINNPINLMKYINLIEEYLQKKAKIKYLPLQQGDVVSTQSDLSSINSSLGYSPKINVKVGVRNFIEWYLDYYKER